MNPDFEQDVKDARPCVMCSANQRGTVSDERTNEARLNGLTGIITTLESADVLKTWSLEELRRYIVNETSDMDDEAWAEVQAAASELTRRANEATVLRRALNDVAAASDADACSGCPLDPACRQTSGESQGWDCPPHARRELGL